MTYTEAKQSRTDEEIAHLAVYRVAVLQSAATPCHIDAALAPCYNGHQDQGATK
jgi:hypothetical protein